MSNYIILRANDKRYKIYGKVILIGGSPCQGFSFAGKMKGAITKCNKDITTLEQYLKLKDEGFEFQGQSYLFWEYIKVLRTIEPDYFLLENVMMVKKWKDMFNDAVGCDPIMINSALVSAQNRKRLYWTNIKVRTPNDKGIVIADILEDGVADSVINCGKEVYKSDIKKGTCLLARDYKGFGNQAMTGVRTMVRVATDINGHDSIKRVYDAQGKSPTVNTQTGGNREVKVLVVPENTKKGYIEVAPSECWDDTFPKSKTRRGSSMKHKSNALLTSHQFMKNEGSTYRKITPLECERLQTVPDNYTNIVSNSQRYKMLGNGWTVDVICHILAKLPI